MGIACAIAVEVRDSARFQVRTSLHLQILEELLQSTRRERHGLLSCEDATDGAVAAIFVVSEVLQVGFLLRGTQNCR